MSLREALKAAVNGKVARCAPYAMQHATFVNAHATGDATTMQQQAATPRQSSKVSATDDATGTQQASCTGTILDGVACNKSCTVARPFALSPRQADQCHEPAWSEAEIAEFVDRHTRAVKFGFSNGDASDLAERLVLRDREGDDRRLCLECKHLLASGRCAAAWRGEISGATRQLAPVVTILQRCDAFAMGKP